MPVFLLLFQLKKAARFAPAFGQRLRVSRLLMAFVAFILGRANGMANGVLKAAGAAVGPLAKLAVPKVARGQSSQSSGSSKSLTTRPCLEGKAYIDIRKV